jgi:hypothetical protein
MSVSPETTATVYPLLFLPQRALNRVNVAFPAH